MKAFFGLLWLSACLFAQTVESVPFRAVLSPANEVPAITGLNASGAGTVWAHVVRDASGQIVSGSVDFSTDFSFPGEVTITGMHIHSGAAGVNGPVTISSGLSGTATVASSDGRGSISKQAQVLPSDANGLDTLRGLFEDPSRYYLNVHTTVNPAGAMRGQLQRADMVVLMGLMSPANEVPAVSLNASAVGSVIALRTTDSGGKVTSGRVIFDVNYTFPAAVTFTGLHIHPGAAGTNGPVAISSGLAAGTPSQESGTGNLHFESEVNLSAAAAVDALNGIFANPGGFYINVHTSANPGGVMRAQLHSTDRMNFQVAMLPSNEVPAIAGVDASAPAAVTVHTLRGPDGNVTAGTVIFDVNHRFTGAAEFTGLHIHDGAASVNGPVTINTGVSGTNTIATDTGFGNIFKIVNVSGGAALATLNALVKSPEGHYINLHTKVNPAGVVRAQLAAADTAVPAVNAVICAISDPSRATVAPGGLMTIFGNNLTKVQGGLAGLEGDVVPAGLNGTEVTIGGLKAPVLVLTSAYIVAQVPLETPSGPQPVVVRNANGAGQPGTVTVAATAPGIFFDSVGAVALNNSDFGLIRPSNPAHAGDVLLIYSTGLGQTTPALQTGRLVSFPPPSNTAATTVTIGGRSADVLYSIASPGFAGLYQTAVRVPAGLPAGNAPVILQVGDAVSNTVNIAVQ